MISDPSSSHALILAPRGRDAAIAAALLAEAEITALVCPDASALQHALSEEVAFVVVAEEALRSPQLGSVAAWVGAQPPWSDLPFVVLTSRAEDHGLTARLSEVLGNVTLLERPFKPITFVSVVRAADKARHRQFQVRGTIEKLRKSQETLVQLTGTLEQRVLERTAELERVHASVLAEIKQRESAEDKLRQSQKLELLGQLTGGVAHDFNNLLMAVAGNLELLRKQAGSDAKSIRLIDGALQGAKRGASLTQRLLAFARRQELDTQAVDLSQLVRNLLDLIERTIGKQIELDVELPAKLPFVLADANQLELALLNLVVNARDAMPEGGRLRISLAPDFSSANGAKHPRFLQLRISDTGSGMSEEILQKATEPFFSTKELGKGTGLGLSMVHGLALQLGGSLNLRSTVGVGTTAELLLPITTREIETGVSAPVARPPSHSGKLSVLVVDDDVLIAMSTSAMIEDLGHTVIETHSGASALEVLRNGRHIDLLLTDFSMPKMNGAELAKAARALRPKLPIVLATGYAEVPSGFDLSLPRLGKPFMQVQLEAALAKAVNGE